MDDICAICLEPNNTSTRIYNQQSYTLYCGHTFHIKCILQWFLRQFTCPVCKKKQIHGMDKIMDMIYSLDIKIVLNKIIKLIMLILLIVPLLGNDIILLFQIIFNLSNHTLKILLIVLNLIFKILMCIFIIFICRISNEFNIINLNINKEIYYILGFYLIYNMYLLIY